MEKLGIKDILETDRCILKIPTESEAEYMWNLIEERTTKYMTWERGENSETTLNNIKKTREKAEKGETWEAAIYDKETGKCIGRCGINRIEEHIPAFELGYWVATEYFGKGIVPECVNRYLKYAFEENDVEKVIIRCDSENKNSARVAVKCGFTLEGTFKNHEKVRGELRNTDFYGIIKSEYKK